jgi:predicted nucleic acid-binding protein
MVHTACRRGHETLESVAPEMQNVPDSHRNGLAMADAIVYATAKDQEAEVITGDADLKDLPGVVYVK